MSQLKKIKVPVQSLKPGMYVSELDRPWLESPFLFQGFMIDNDETLLQLCECCEFVYVDVEQSDQDVRANLQSISTHATSQTTQRANPFLTNEVKSGTPMGDFSASLKRARRVYDNTRKYIDRAMEDVRLGDSVNTDDAKQLVAAMVDEIVHSASAMQWLTYLKNRDEYTAIHSMNVCILALSFGRWLKLSKADLNLLGLGALLHDLGKMKIPDEVLNKPGKLTGAEFEVMKMHPFYGHEMLKESGEIPDEALHAVLHHHERKRGQGYPHGLAENELPLMTQIVAIVDVYDAVTSDRCYHDGVAPFVALQNMYSWTKDDFDKELVENFIKCLGIYPVGSLVELSNGQIGIVVSASEKSRLRPVVMLVLDSDKRVLKVRKLINLASSMWQTGANALQISHILEPGSYGVDVKKILLQESNY